MARKTFDTTEYEFSHGRLPRGRGSWAFAPADDPDNEDRWEWRTGTYTEAHKELPDGAWKVLP